MMKVNKLLLENEELRLRLAEAEEALNAIRNGEVDAIVVSGSEGEKIFSLTSAETPYRTIVEQMNEGAVKITPDGIILYCNSKFSDLLSLPFEQIVGSDFIRFIRESDFSKFYDLLKKGQKENCNGLISVLSQENKQLYLNLSFSPISKGSQNDICIIVSDITEMKLLEAEVKQSNQELEIRVQERTSELTKTNNDLSESRHAIMNMMQDALEAKEALVLSNCSLGKEIKLREKAEEETRKLNEELEQRVVTRTAQLETSNKELEAFSYSVSHDLRSPLRAVHGFSEILMSEYSNILGDEGKRICRIISSSASQMGELIDDLLSFSRLGRSGMNPALVDMESMVNDVITNLSDENGNQKINFINGKLHQVYGDALLIRQVWINLISNAIKYSSKQNNPEISITSSTEGNNVTFFVKDNGVGFDMKYKHKLFGVFQRLHSEKEFEGNGVGLAIIQRIILKHHGSVGAEGGINKGATFWFSLPLNNESLRTQENTNIEIK